MSTTRKLTTELNEIMPHPKRVQPTKTLLVQSGRCEVQAAMIRNRTLDSMDQNDIAEIIRRLDQSRRGVRNSLFEAIILPLALPFYLKIILQLYALASAPNNRMENSGEEQLNDNLLPEHFIYYVMMLLMIAYTLFAVLHIPPSIANTIRYRETNALCKDWLIKHVGETTVNTITGLSSDNLKRVMAALKSDAKSGLGMKL